MDKICIMFQRADSDYLQLVVQLCWNTINERDCTQPHSPVLSRGIPRPVPPAERPVPIRAFRLSPIRCAFSRKHVYQRRTPQMPQPLLRCDLFHCPATLNAPARAMSCGTKATPFLKHPDLSESLIDLSAVFSQLHAECIQQN